MVAKKKNVCYSSFPRRGVAQSGSAPALGAEGREFESIHPDQNFEQVQFNRYKDRPPVAQLDRASAF